MGVKLRYSDSMSEEIEIAGIKVPKAGWAATPASIRAVVVVLSERLQQQDERIRQLEERLNKNSKNSSNSPSSDGFAPSSNHQEKVKKRKSQGNSKFSPRQVRKLKPSEAYDQVQEVVPSVCSGCGASLSGHDPHPHRHQKLELPPIEPQVIEYRLHQLSCVDFTNLFPQIKRVKFHGHISPGKFSAGMTIS